LRVISPGSVGAHTLFLVYQIDNRLVGCKRMHARKGCDSNCPGVRKGAPTSM
jgi:hypothetical protein